MARPRKDTTTDNLERQIKKLQERVIKTNDDSCNIRTSIPEISGHGFL